jgi:hypothetical protein
MPDPYPTNATHFTGDCFWCGEVFDSGSATVCPTCAMPVHHNTDTKR